MTNGGNGVSDVWPPLPKTGMSLLGSESRR